MCGGMAAAKAVLPGVHGVSWASLNFPRVGRGVRRHSEGSGWCYSPNNRETHSWWSPQNSGSLT